jgi:hypothetical protein
MPPPGLQVLVDNDNVVRLNGAQVTNLTTGERQYLDAQAVVQFRVQDEDYEDVAGETWPVTMTYLANSQGNFIGVLAADVALEADTDYHFLATVEYGANAHGTWDIPLRVLTRDET